MTETLACGYSSESTQQELSNEYQHDTITSLRPYALDQSSLSIGRVNPPMLTTLSRTRRKSAECAVSPHSAQTKNPLKNFYAHASVKYKEL